LGKVPERAAFTAAVHGATANRARSRMIGQTFGMAAARTINHPVDGPPSRVRVVSRRQKPGRQRSAGGNDQPNGGLGDAER